MGSVSVSLPVPVSDGVGAFVDCSGLSPERTINFDHGAFAGSLFLEGTNDAGASVFPIAVGPFTGVNGSPAPQNLLATIQQMRVRRTGSTSGPAGTPTVTVSAPVATANVFGDLPVPASDGVGAGVDVSAGGDVNTIGIQGPFSGQIVIEVSTDGGATFVGSVLAGLPSLTTPGSPAAFNLTSGAISQVRVRRFGSIPGRPSPAISVGSGSTSGGAGAFPGYGTPGTLGPTLPTAGVSALVLRADSLPGQLIEATWPIAQVRWYAVDGTNGDDNAIGFSDVSEADAGTKAKKTIAGLNAIFPPVGNGRGVQVVIAAGTYADAPTFLMSVHGYQLCTVKGTATQPNAGSVAFAGTANSDVFCGGITVPGLNAGGYNPTAGATTTVIPCQINGGGAPGFPAEPAAPLGWRVRFDINTATAALRGVCRPIAVVATATLTISDAVTALPAVPAPADVFYVEKAGVIGTAVSWKIGAPATESMQIAGMDMGPVQVFIGRAVFCFSAAASLGVESPSYWQSVSAYQVGLPIANRFAGGGLRVAGTVTNLISGGAITSQTGLVALGLVEVLQPAVANINQGYYGGGLAFQGSGNSPQFTDHVGVIGSFNAIPIRIRGNTAGTPGGPAGLLFRGARTGVGNIVIDNQGAAPAIRVIGVCELFFAGGNSISGSVGNNDVGLDLFFATGSILRFDVIPTVTGALGDVRLSNGTIVSWAQIAATGITDGAGNRLIGPGAFGAAVSVVGKFSGVIVTDAGAATSTQLGDPGSQPAIASNSSSNMEYPTSLRWISRLRVMAQTGNGATPYTVTLMRRPLGGAQAVTLMTVTVPGGAAVASVFSDVIHPILFSDGDTYALQVDSAATGEGNKVMQATLEGPS